MNSISKKNRKRKKQTHKPYVKALRYPRDIYGLIISLLQRSSVHTQAWFSNGPGEIPSLACISSISAISGNTKNYSIITTCITKLSILYSLDIMHLLEYANFMILVLFGRKPQTSEHSQNLVNLEIQELK